MAQQPTGGQGESGRIGMPQTGGLPKVKGPEFNDRDRLNDALLMEKYLTFGYNISVNEASHDALYRDLLDILNESHHFQRQLWQTMFNKGWYKMEVADTKAVDKAYTDFNNYKTQLPYRTPPPQ